jgi:hypothetical protein
MKRSGGRTWALEDYCQSSDKFGGCRSGEGRKLKRGKEEEKRKEKREKRKEKR